MESLHFTENPCVLEGLTMYGNDDGLCALLLAGVIAYGIDGSGKHARASGWGPSFLDGGSGYDIGALLQRYLTRHLTFNCCYFSRV